jgi:hypothetical protein
VQLRVERRLGEEWGDGKRVEGGSEDKYVIVDIERDE